MIMIVFNDPGGMTYETAKESTCLMRNYCGGRYWMDRDSKQLQNFAKESETGDYEEFSKGLFIKLNK